MSAITKSIDARGSYCPGPLMELIKSIKSLAIGETVEVLSSDAGSAKDIPEWVKKVGHELLYVEAVDHYWKIAVQKKR